MQLFILKETFIKFLAHDTDMKIPISNALEIKNKVDKEKINKNLLKLNNLNFEFPKNFFPLLDIIKLIPEKSSYFEDNTNDIKWYIGKEIFERWIKLFIASAKYT